MEAKHIERLGETKLFQRIDKEEIENILKDIDYKILRFHKDESIVFRGDEVEGLYIILSGEVFCEMSGDRGDVKKIEDLPEGSVLAGAFIFGRNNYFPVDVFSRTDVEIFFIDKKEFLNLLHQEFRMMENALNIISQKAQFLSGKIWQGVNNKTIRQKLADYIINNMEGDEIKFKPSLNEVANLFNIARPSLSRVITSFVEEGILERNGRKYIVKDKEGLLL